MEKYVRNTVVKLWISVDNFVWIMWIFYCGYVDKNVDLLFFFRRKKVSKKRT